MHIETRKYKNSITTLFYEYICYEPIKFFEQVLVSFEIPGTQGSTYLVIVIYKLDCVYVHD